MYFKLRDLNEELPESTKINNLRSLITYEYSEKILLYKLLERSFGNRYIQKSGELIEKCGIEGFVDYYIRNGNKIFLFESKDILINAEVKNSNHYQIIENELKRKLYIEERDGKKIPRAIIQLIKSIVVLLDGNFILDKKYKCKSIKIFPIIILHNRQLEILGLNQVVKSWFREELFKLKAQSYDISKVNDVVIMNIDSLILFSDQILDRTIRLEDLIVQYNKCSDQSDFENKKFRDMEHRDEAFRELSITFSEFLRKTCKWEKPNLFNEKGYTLFK